MADGKGAHLLRLRCPACESVVGNIDFGLRSESSCPVCGFTIVEVSGILRCLTLERKEHFERFVRNYQVVRTKEGWGSRTPDYYLALPFRDLTNKHNWIWRIRARTLLYIQKHILPKIECGHSAGCRILDIGAGNGWLSYRLAQCGHYPVAVDLLDDDVDGLGAARHYLAQFPKGFPRFQADMNHLPFDSGQFDIAIFNASFHYSSDYETTLREALRCLRRPAFAVIADSPFYWCEESGRRMLEERKAFFERQFGVASDCIQSRDYLTPRALKELAEQLAIQWNVCKPWYGLGWALRPAKAKLLRRREPSKFYLLWFKIDR